MSLQGKYIDVQGTCATSGEGLLEGLTWIQEALMSDNLTHASSDKEVLISDKEHKLSHRWWRAVSRCFVRSPT